MDVSNYVIFLILINKRSLQQFVIKQFLKKQRMGCASYQGWERSQLCVATLSYSGILLSPFEFYQKQDKAQQLLNMQMEKMLEADKMITKEKTFSFYYLEKEWKKGRYSPLYLKDCGVKNHILLGEQEFKRQWDKVKSQYFHDESHQRQLIQCYQAAKRAKKQKMEKVTKQGKMGQNDKSLKKSQIQIEQEKGNIKAKNLDEANRNKLERIKEMLNFMEPEFQQLMKFDYLIYKSIIYQTYRQDEQKQYRRAYLQGKSKFELSAQKYMKFMRQKFSKSYLNEEEKIKTTIRILKTFAIDIFFLQQVTEEFVAAIEKQQGYRVIKVNKKDENRLKSKSIIVLKVSKFPKLLAYEINPYNSIHNIERFVTSSSADIYEEIKQLSELKNIIIQFVDNLILINCYFSSDRVKNQQHISLLKAKIRCIKSKFPDCHLIVSGILNDDNFNMENQTQTQIEDRIYVFPNCNRHFTSYKNRTFLQCQPKKAEKTDKGARSYIVTDLQLKQSRILNADGIEVIDCERLRFILERREKVASKYKNLERNSLPLLPNQSHPYNHFVVFSRVVLPASHNSKLSRHNTL